MSNMAVWDIPGIHGFMDVWDNRDGTFKVTWRGTVGCVDVLTKSGPVSLSRSITAIAFEHDAYGQWICLVLPQGTKIEGKRKSYEGTFACELRRTTEDMIDIFKLGGWPMCPEYAFVVIDNGDCAYADSITTNVNTA